jgi:hypothetical protein
MTVRACLAANTQRTAAWLRGVNKGEPSRCSLKIHLTDITCQRIVNILRTYCAKTLPSVAGGEKVLKRGVANWS